MEDCPLCASPAATVAPEWSGGRIVISCARCGEYSSNAVTIRELAALQAVGSPRIRELQHSVATADHPWHITKSQRLGLIVLESSEPEPMTKRQKKHRRRTRTTGRSATFSIFYLPGHDSNSTE